MDKALLAFTSEEMVKLSGVISLAIVVAEMLPSSERIKEISEEAKSLDRKILLASEGLDEVTSDATKELRSEGWDKARNEVRGIPYWYAEEDKHGFDLWEDENGYAQESGARIAVMKILDNNPYSDGYVDPYANRPKRTGPPRKRGGDVRS